MRVAKGASVRVVQGETGKATRELQSAPSTPSTTKESKAKQRRVQCSTVGVGPGPTRQADRGRAATVDPVPGPTALPLLRYGSPSLA